MFIKFMGFTKVHKDWFIKVYKGLRSRGGRKILCEAQNRRSSGSEAS